ncbi:MAG: 6-bladed beta-propeller [Bacteroidales bacterium]|nr:6-bladed beta-propeller [Bacteroidales bacterium]
MKSSVQFFLLLLLLPAVFTSCKNSNSESEKSLLIYDLKELPRQTTLKLSDLSVKDIQYLPLETTEESVIPGIRKIIRADNYFLVQAFSDIFMFRYDGSFVTKIGIVGRGPNEFTVAHDIDIDQENGNIYLIDGWQQKFLVYSGNGEFIRTFHYPVRSAVNFRIIQDGILCYNLNTMGDVETSYILLDTTGQIIKSFPNKYPWTRTLPTLAFQNENIFFRYNDRLLTKTVYCDTLYVFRNKDFEPYSIIDIGDRRITPEVRTGSEAEFIMKHYINPMNLFEFADYLYYEFFVPLNEKPEGLSVIASKDGSYKVLFDPEKDLINDIDGGPVIWPKAAWDDNTVVSWTEAMKLKTLVASENFRNCKPEFPEKKKELESLAAGLKEEDNPVLILIRFK